MSTLSAAYAFPSCAIVVNEDTIMTNLQEIFMEWQSNLQFREEFKKDPEMALKHAGFEVTERDLVKIRAMFKLDKSKDEKLDDRISK